jgi:hypothetical protein
LQLDMKTTSSTARVGNAFLNFISLFVLLVTYLSLNKDELLMFKYVITLLTKVIALTPC